MAKILIVDDEKAINDLIKKSLTLVGHETKQVYDGQAAVEAVYEEPFDLMILDVMLPGLSGYEVIAQVRDVPVIFITAKGRLEDRLRGLRAGGDDYIVKPFAMDELIARVDAVLRRTDRAGGGFSFDDVEIDYRAKSVTKGGRTVPLKPKEYELFETLVRNRNVALSREKLIALIWGYDYAGDERTVDVHIAQLRHKLGLGYRLKTVYKTGYRLEV